MSNIVIKVHRSNLEAGSALVKPVSHRGRSEYVFTHSGQNPVLVNMAELLPGFPINRNQFVATSA